MQSSLQHQLPVAGPHRRMLPFARGRAALGRLASSWFRGQVPQATGHGHLHLYDFDELGNNKRGLAASSALQSIDEVEHHKRKAEQGQEEAKEAAIKLLAARPHSQKELRAKLLEKGFGTELIKSALDRLHELGLQSDREFAEVFARSKWRTSKWGAAKLEAELARRGVAREHIAPALQQVFGGEGLQLGHHIADLDGGPPAAAAAEAGSWARGAGVAPDPAGVLLAVARRQFELSRGLAMEARKRRLAGWLQRRGHRWGDVSKILKQLEKEAAARALDAESEEELP